MTSIQKLTIKIRNLLKKNNLKTIEKLKPLIYSQQIDWKNYKHLINLHQQKLETRHVIKYYKDYEIKKLEGDSDYYYKMTLPYTDESDIFGLHLIKWMPFSKSLIHNHEDMGCLFKVMEGELEESIFDNNYFDLMEVKSYQSQQSSQERNDIAYIDNNIGLHSIQNITKFPTYSLHLYANSHQNKDIKTYSHRNFSLIKYFPFS